MRNPRAPRRQRFYPGYIAWLLQRLTGILLGLYLFVHIWVVHHLSKGQRAFDEVMAVVQSPLFHLLEIGLLGTVIYHALNGARVVAMDAGWLSRREGIARTVYAIIVVSAVLTLIGAVPFVRLALGH